MLARLNDDADADADAPGLADAGQGEHASDEAGAGVLSDLPFTPQDTTALGPMGPSRLLLSKPVIAAVSGAAVAGGMELALWCDMRVMEQDAYFGVYCRRFGVPLIDGGTVRLPRLIAAVSGAAVAGGMELALWCDLRVMEQDAYFGVYCRRFGVPLIDGGTVRLPRLIGMGHAMDLILTGRKVEAAEALQMGLCNRVVPRGQALEAALELAQQLCRFPQKTMLADRISAYTQWSLDLPHALHQEWERGKLFIGEGLQGAARFSAGAGRHGKF